VFKNGTLLHHCQYYMVNFNSSLVVYKSLFIMEEGLNVTQFYKHKFTSIHIEEETDPTNLSVSERLNVHCQMLLRELWSEYSSERSLERGSLGAVPFQVSISIITQIKRCCDLCSGILFEIDKNLSRTPLSSLSLAQQHTMTTNLTFMLGFTRVLFGCIDSRLQKMFEHVTHFITYYLKRLGQPVPPPYSTLMEDGRVMTYLQRVFETHVRFQAPRGSIYRVTPLVYRKVRMRRRSISPVVRRPRSAREASEERFRNWKAQVTWYICKSNFLIITKSRLTARSRTQTHM
jgi:hypothetical protein